MLWELICCIGKHHQLNIREFEQTPGYIREFEQTPGYSEGQGSLECYSP